MSYNRNIPCADPCRDDTCKAVEREPSMADLMKEASVMASDALYAARRINGFMTGDLTEECSNSQETTCFRDELMKARYSLAQLNHELSKLSLSLGCM